MSIVLTIVRRLCDQPLTGPSAVLDQSYSALRRAISPPPTKGVPVSDTLAGVV